MLRDASQKQVIQKFSFIEDVDASRGIKTADRQVSDEIEVDIDRAFNFIPQTNSNSTSVSQESETADESDKSSKAIVTINDNDTVKANTLTRLTKSDVSELDLAEIIRYSALNYPVGSKVPQRRNYLGKILFALSCSYSLFVLWWLFGHQGIKLITHLTGGKYITLSRSDVEFIDRLEKSITTLDRQLAAKKAESEGDQVMYVPVYTPQNSTPTVSAPATLAKPQTPSSRTGFPTTPPALKIPAPPPLPTATPIPESTVAPQPADAPQPVAAKPVIKHTLTGILDLGVGKSAALIRVNGQTRRFWIGEEIGNSGWILESVTNQTAKVKDGARIRSIAVGETF
ncbi:MAG: hypothetical protein AAGE96_25115 [Cyanobacteria bacterium P01_G01_bin.19]